MSALRNNQSFPEKADKLIRHYEVPYRTSKEEMLEQILGKIDAAEKQGREKVRKIYRFSMAGAAALILLLIAFYFFTASVTISAGGEASFASRLPDGSRVVLHQDSRIEYLKYFRNRNINLYGEAYFEVLPGKKFNVLTPSGAVQVLGTRFLVSHQGPALQVKCYEGKVQTNFGNRSWVLERGTQFSGAAERAEKTVLKTDNGYPEFALFRESFSNTPFPVVVNELEAFFGVEIIIRDGRAKNFSGSFQTGDLENALKILCQPFNLSPLFINRNEKDMKIVITKGKN